MNTLPLEGVRIADFGLAELYANNRIHRLTDGPDEVHHMVVGRAEAQKHVAW